MQEVNQECVDRPIVSLPIADEQNIGRGNLEIFVGQEPIDVINAFVQSRGLPKTYRQFLYRMLCENNGGGNHGRDLICVRSDPALEYEFILVRYLDSYVHIIILKTHFLEKKRYRPTHLRISVNRTVRTNASLVVL